MGNHLRAGLGQGSTADTLDPATYGNGFTIALHVATHNHIGEIGVTRELIPELVEGCDASDDAATWSLKIRQDVEFHNGKTFEAWCERFDRFWQDSAQRANHPNFNGSHENLYRMRRYCHMSASANFRALDFSVWRLVPPKRGVLDGNIVAR